MRLSNCDALDLASLSLGDAPAVLLDLLALPRALALDILVRLPVDTRLRCIEVSRAWRALLEEASLWSSLSLSWESGFSVSLFRTAAAKAGGQLRCLDVAGHRVHDDNDEGKLSQKYRLKFSVLHDVVVANSTTLVELHLSTFSSIYVDKLAALCRSAPTLKLLRTNAWCNSVVEVNTLLLKQEPFSCLQLTQLCIHNTPETIDDVAVSTIAKQLADNGHTLIELTFLSAPISTAAAMGAIVDVAISLSKLDLNGCRATPATVPALTRLVAAGRLRVLEISNDDIVLFEDGADATRLFCDAVRASSLKLCYLHGVGHAHELEELEVTFPGDACTFKQAFCTCFLFIGSWWTRSTYHYVP